MNEMEGILAEYKQSLDELVFNSKPHISMLTVMAEENHNVAPEIVRIIVTRIYEAPWKHKLPALYLIDSIVKNFGGQYKKLFGQNLINVFLRVFDKAEARTRQDLFKLRQTWEPVFSRSLLQKLDQAVHQMDKHWPVVGVGHKKSRHKSEKPPKFEVSPSTSTSHSNKSDTADYKDGEIEVEEEEIILDEDGYEQLAELEATLKAKQAELDKLEILENQKGSLEPTSDVPLPVVQPGPENFQIHSGVENAPLNITNGHVDAQFSPQVVLPSPALASEHGISPQIEQSIPHPQLDRTVGEVVDNTTLLPSHVTPVQPDDTTAELSPPQISSIVAAVAAERLLSRASPPPPPVINRTTHASVQTTTVETQDVAIQSRSRRKTKNFTNQFRAPSKSFGVMIRPRIREAATQVEAGDLPRNPDEDDKEDFDLWERNVDKTARNLYCTHALRMFHSFRRMLDADDLCDVVVMVENKEYPAHKLVLSGSSDFFYNAFCSNVRLSEVSLEATPEFIWRLVLNYFYSSRLEMKNLTKSDIKALMVTIQGLKIHTLFGVCAELESALDLDADMKGWYIQDERIIKPGEEPPTLDPIHDNNRTVNGFVPPPQPPVPVESPRLPVPDVPCYEPNDQSSLASMLSSSPEDLSEGPSSKEDETRAVISKPPREVKAPVKEEPIPSTPTPRSNRLKEERSKRKRRSPPRSEKKSARKSTKPVLHVTTTDSDELSDPSVAKKEPPSSKKKKKRPAAPAASSSSSLSSSSSSEDEAPAKKRKVEEEHRYTCGQCGKRFTDINHLSQCRSSRKKTKKDDKPKKVKEKNDVATPSDSSKEPESRRRKRESRAAPDTPKSTLERKSTPQTNKKSSTKTSERSSSKKKPTTPKPAAKHNGGVTVSKSNRAGADIKNKPSSSATPAKIVNSPAASSSAFRFNCEVCGEGFHIQCVYKKHMNGHKSKN